MNEPQSLRATQIRYTRRLVYTLLLINTHSLMSVATAIQIHIAEHINIQINFSSIFLCLWYASFLNQDSPVSLQIDIPKPKPFFILLHQTHQDDLLH